MYFFVQKLGKKIKKDEKMLKDVMEYLPENIKAEIKIYLEKQKEAENKIEEIRIRINQKIAIKIGQNIEVIGNKITKDELNETFENICEKSIYSYTKQISEGFITIKGGNRVGITGSCVIENEKVKNINYISSLNFRISRQIEDVSIPLLRYIIDIENDTIFNTMIVSKPGGGKTTVLRDLAKKISNRYAKNKLFS